LLHQEGRRHRGVVMRIDALAVQRAQRGRALERILQALVGLVDAHCPLHRHALRGGATSSETVGVDLRLQRLPACIDIAALLFESLREAEQREVVVVELHHTRNDSPQPQRSFSRGLWNLKPSLRPSRTKSSSVPSMYGRLFGSTSTFTPWPSNTTSSGATSSAYSSL